jgi:hypothetical protein
MRCQEAVSGEVRASLPSWPAFKAHSATLRVPYVNIHGLQYSDTATHEQSPPSNASRYLISNLSIYLSMNAPDRRITRVSFALKSVAYTRVSIELAFSPNRPSDAGEGLSMLHMKRRLLV